MLYVHAEGDDFELGGDLLVDIITGGTITVCTEVDILSDTIVEDAEEQFYMDFQVQLGPPDEGDDEFPSTQCLVVILDTNEVSGLLCEQSEYSFREGRDEEVDICVRIGPTLTPELTVSAASDSATGIFIFVRPILDFM